MTHTRAPIIKKNSRTDLNAWLGQNIDEGTADVVGVAFAIVGDAVGDRILRGLDGLRGADRTRIGRVLNVSRSHGIATSTAGVGGDGDGVVGCDADIHVRNVDPLWRMCKPQICTVMQW